MPTVKKNELVLATSQSDLDIIQSYQKNTKTNYEVGVLVKRIADGINTKNSPTPVGIADVLTVMQLASSMHLDPILGGIYAFKGKDDKLTCSVSLKGWKQALSTQPSYAGIYYKRPPFREFRKADKKGNVVKINAFDYVTCIIVKTDPNGNKQEFEGTAYFDEEFDSNKDTWLTRPKRMLENRALCIAAANAFGWGAYDPEEVDSYYRSLADTQTVTRGQKRVADALKAEEKTEQKTEQTVIDDPKSALKVRMQSCVSVQELGDVFRNASKELQEDEEIKELGRVLAANLREQEKENGINL